MHLNSEKLAIAAHLHVLLRRKSGRVTDTEWMASNREYAAEIVRFARTKATEEGQPDLADWAGKLEAVMTVAKPPPPAVSQPMDAVATSWSVLTEHFKNSSLKPASISQDRYIGRLR
jgi:hypothetical protein